MAHAETTTETNRTTQTTLNGEEVSDKDRAPKRGSARILWYHDPETPLETVATRIQRLRAEGMI